MWTASTELSPTQGHFKEKGLTYIIGKNWPTSTSLTSPWNHLIFLANTDQPPHVEFPIMLRSLTSEVPPDRQPQGGSVVDVDISPRRFLMAFALY